MPASEHPSDMRGTEAGTEARASASRSATIMDGGGNLTQCIPTAVLESRVLRPSQRRRQRNRMYRGDEAMSPTREQVRAACARRFPDEDAATILAMLDPYGVEPHEPERERVQLAILKLSCGDADRLLSTVQAANEDYPDVLWWAEYPNPNGPQQGPPEDTEALLGWLRH